MALHVISCIEYCQLRCFLAPSRKQVELTAKKFTELCTTTKGADCLAQRLHKISWRCVWLGTMPQQYSRINQEGKSRLFLRRGQTKSGLHLRSFGVGAAWKERDGRKSRTMSLGRYLTETGAVAFAIDMVLKEYTSILSKTDHRSVEVVNKSRPALVEIQNLHGYTAGY